jgi:MSHA biogenesis protein MshO
MTKHMSKGFTLVELVIVIVITGALAVSLVSFFTPAMDSYFATKRRAGLTDAADTALRRMKRDVQLAVPNSIRIPNNQCFELAPSSTGGRYRMGPDTVNDVAAGCAPAIDCSAWLDTATPSAALDVLSPLSSTPAAGDWLVINNQNGNDVYAGVNSVAIAAVANSNFGQHRFIFAATQFPVGYEGGRFTVVANNGGAPTVFYICSGADGALDSSGNGKGTLFRLNRAFDAAYPTSCPSTTGAAILAKNVRTCNFVYNPTTGDTQQNGYVWMQLELAERNETVPLSAGAHVNNTP